jgi:hypothetical protein
MNRVIRVEGSQIAQEDRMASGLNHFDLTQCRVGVLVENIKTCEEAGVSV